MDDKASPQQPLNQNSKLPSKNSQEVFKIPDTFQAPLSRGPSKTSCENEDRITTCVKTDFNTKEKKIDKENDKLVDPPNLVNKNNNQNAANKEDSELSPSSKLKSVSIPYKEPTWGGLDPPSSGNETSLYSLEELKNGVIIATHQLSKSFQVVGRLPTCDIQLEHPSLSRYHAVLQFKATCSLDKPAGFYLYDLDSTHGTFHNKNKCFPKTYYRLRVGHMIKFGGSTRYLILQGPEEDTESESELSVTELKELAAEKAKRRQEEKLSQEVKMKESESRGISWGMPEDAVEDEENENKSEQSNSIINLSAENENLYLNDPKKTLRGWFEREGYDLEYDCKELSCAKFKCTVLLPIEDENGTTSEIVAEAIVSGKKKEAVVSCALEACRILDRRGVLRASKHESRQKKNVKKWEENDYYDSDEDEFLDRTGALQAKRQKRMQSVKEHKLTDVCSQEIEKAAPETFESLTVKHEIVSNEIAELKKRISKAKQSMDYLKNHTHDDINEDLDAYMAAIEGSADCSKVELGKLTNQLADLMSKSKKLERMIEVARPVKIPGFMSSKNTEILKEREDEGNKTKKSANIIVGKMFSRGIGKMKPINPNYKQASTLNISISKTTNILPESDTPKNCDQVNPMKEENKLAKNEVDSELKEKKTPLLATSTAPRLNSSISVHNDRTTESINQPSTPSKKIKQPISLKRKNSEQKSNELKTATHTQQNSYEEMSEQDERYTAWMPPKNQSGDGRTSLNDKYGY